MCRVRACFAHLHCHLEQEVKLVARPTSQLHSHAAGQTLLEVQKEPGHDTAQGTHVPGAINRCSTSAQRHSELAFDGVDASWEEHDVVAREVQPERCVWVGRDGNLLASSVHAS